MLEYVMDSLGNGGLWSPLVFVVGIALYVFVVVQFFKVKTKDFRSIMWGLFLFVIIAGVLGTLVGMQQACAAVASVEAAEQIGALSRGFSIAAYPFGLALVLCGWGVIPLTIASGKVAKWQKTSG